MSKDFHLTIYNKIRNGDKVESFEKWMFNKLPPKSMLKLNTPYYKVRDLLVRDFTDGNIPYRMSWRVKKYLNWLFEHGRINVEPSSCTPHSRQLDNLILYSLYFTLNGLHRNFSVYLINSILNLIIGILIGI